MLEALMKRFHAVPALAVLVIGFAPAPVRAEEQHPAGQEKSRSRFEQVLSEATLIGKGVVAAYRKGDRYLIELNAERFDGWSFGMPRL
jgi:hypothetical protein